MSLFMGVTRGHRPRRARRSAFLGVLAAFAAAAASFSPSAGAAIVSSGFVSPAPFPSNGNTLSFGGSVAIGTLFPGSLEVNNGSDVISLTTSVGLAGNGLSTGSSFLVTGAGSTWTNSASMLIGQRDRASAAVEASGTVIAGTAVVSGGGSATAGSSLTIREAFFDVSTGMDVGRAASGFSGNGAGVLRVLNTDGGLTNLGRLRVGSNVSAMTPSGIHIGTGTMRVAEGSTVETDARVSVGLDAGSNGLLTVSGAGSSFTSTNENRNRFFETLLVGGAGTGRLEARDGASVQAKVVQLGRIAGGVGTLLLEGEGTTLTGLPGLSSGLRIGDAGHAELLIRQGADAVFDSTFLAGSPGEAGEGSLVIESGGLLRSYDGMLLGRNIPGVPGGTASIALSGAGTRLVLGNEIASETEPAALMQVEREFRAGNGATISNDGTLEVGTRSSQGLVELSGAGTRYSGVGKVTVGGGSTAGSIFVTDGAELQAGDLEVAQGSVQVVDGTLGLTGNLTILGSGSALGQLEVLNGSGVSATRIDVGGFPASEPAPQEQSGPEPLTEPASLQVRGVGSTVSGEVRIGFMGPGLVEIDGGTMSVSQSVSVFPLGVLRGSGQVGPLLVSGGRVEVGFDSTTGDLTTTTFQQVSGSTLALDLSGSAPGEYDRLLVNNLLGTTAVLGGTLELDLREGFMPEAGDTLEIVRVFNSLPGGFAPLMIGSFSGLPDGATFVRGQTEFRIDYDGGSVGGAATVTLSVLRPVIPEPGSAAGGLVMAAFGCGLRRRRG